jgi:hypothetical protein
VGDREGKDEKAVSPASANDSFTSHSFRDVWLCSGVIRPSGGRIVVFCPACMRRRVCVVSDVGEVTKNTSLNGMTRGADWKTRATGCGDARGRGSRRPARHGESKILHRDDLRWTTRRTCEIYRFQGGRRALYICGVGRRGLLIYLGSQLVLCSLLHMLGDKRFDTWAASRP